MGGADPEAKTGVDRGPPGHGLRRDARRRDAPPPAGAPPERARARVVDRLFRRESGQAVAVLARILGDLDRAEEAVQDAFLVALERWPAHGVPANPAAWIVTAARNRAIDRIRAASAAGPGAERAGGRAARARRRRGRGRRAE